MGSTILVIDDDATLVEIIGDHLRKSGYEPVAALTGPQGLEIARDQSPALIILDVMMPEMDGWEVCRQLRSQTPAPVIMLTAKGEEVDKLRGFRLGVDDYVTKPFSFAELIARVGAVLNRVSGAVVASPRLESGDLVIDYDQRRVFVSGQIVDLSAREFHLLEVLARHFQRPISTDMLLQEVWGAEYAGEPDHVKHYIWALRKKIEADPGDPKHILTEHGFGYRFE
jgi:two-component system KDP operon response regulator KdpE